MDQMHIVKFFAQTLCRRMYVPEADSLVLVCQMDTTIKIVSLHCACCCTKVVLRAAIRGKIVVVAAVLGYLWEHTIKIVSIKFIQTNHVFPNYLHRLFSRCVKQI